ncbi:MAG TPA: hypothetical protein VFK54_03665 [Candidatus Limnocylindrales bacterium]|nr:hypothetical protein [Candidatus Limnocylindrales bacterium]
MAKRSRGSVRPGQRRPTARRPASGSSRPAGAAGAAEAPRPSTLTDAEAARAAEIEAAILAEERAAAVAAQARRERARQGTDRYRPGATLAAEEAIEYAYVERDIRRILITAGAMLGTLLVLWLILEVGGLAPF